MVWCPFKGGSGVANLARSSHGNLVGSKNCKIVLERANYIGQKITTFEWLSCHGRPEGGQGASVPKDFGRSLFN